MALQVLRAQDRTPAPWKNGGGVTSEVAARPEGAGTGDFVWRVSIADVARSGPFSVFEDVDRIITVVDGPGMTLTVDGTSHEIAAPYEPFAFRGDSETECELLGGPIVDFNVMVRRADATADVRIMRDRFTVRPEAGTCVLAVVLRGLATLGKESIRLGRLDAVLFAEGDADDVDVDGVLALVTVADRGED
ncbi:HutD family protein [Streptomyces sp. NPDC057280]|uniref:HutD/Ves family protein n=1 Tax=Streptomyces sp. NPDC057280 TaxID=3346081 RepID=UPI00363329F5